MTDTPLPLDGIRVLDVATFIAAPFAAALMAEFGAEVIKVEQPGTGDPLRQFGTPTDLGDTLVWLTEARNKTSVTLDLRKPEGADLFRRLVAKADVVCENFRPGTLERWGLGWDVLSAINPGLVLLRVSAYGQDGPWTDRPGFARIAHAVAGLTHLAGMPGGPPVTPGSTSLADYGAGLFGAFAVMAALRSRDMTGRGQVIDVALYEAMFRCIDELAPAFDRGGVVRDREGMSTRNACPHGHFPTRDGRWVAIACTSDRMFARLAQVMGRPELAAPGRYARAAARIADRETVERLVGDWTAAHDADALIDICVAGEVPCGLVHTIADIFASPLYRERGTLARVDDPRAGPLTVPGIVPRLSATPGRIDHLGPALGDGNARIYGDLLGLDAGEIDRLGKAGII